MTSPTPLLPGKPLSPHNPPLPHTPFAPHRWDLSYWAEKQRASKYDITEEELKPYMAYPNVLDGLFKVGALRARGFEKGNLQGAGRHTPSCFAGQRRPQAVCVVVRSRD